MKLSFFSAEILSSIITGVIVGLILWGFQLRREKILLKHHYEREISILKEKLYFVNYRGDAFGVAHVMYSQPLFVEEIIEILQDHPLDLMERYAYHNKELAALLHRFKNKYLEVRKNAEKLEIITSDYIRHYHANKGKPLSDDEAYKVYFSGKIYDLDEEEIQVYLDDVHINNELRSVFANFREQHSSSISQYVESRKELIEYAHEIEKAVVHHQPNPFDK